MNGAFLSLSPVHIGAYVLALLGIYVLFSLWSDVDTNPTAQTLFYTVFLAIDGVLILTRQFEAAAFFGLLAILPVLSRHRKWTHRWWIALLVPFPMLLVPFLFYPDQPLVGVPLYGAAGLGHATHLLLRRRRLRRRT